MKKIEAIIRPEKLPVVKDALKEIGFQGMTVTEVNGHGNEKAIVEVWRTREFKVDMLPKSKLEIVVSDYDVDSVTRTIVREACTGDVGDGRIFVSDIQQAVRIRDLEMGDNAIHTNGSHEQACPERSEGYRINEVLVGATEIVD